RHRRLDGPGLRERRGTGREQGEAGLLGEGVSLLLAEERPVECRWAPTMEGLYTPSALQRPAGDGPHPFVFLAYGNGGGGLDWLREGGGRRPDGGGRVAGARVAV